MSSSIDERKIISANIPYKKLVILRKKYPDIVKQIVSLINEHHMISNYKFSNILKEHLTYPDNVKYDANLFILLYSLIVIGIARVERNVNGTIYISSVHISHSYRGLGLCHKIMNSIISHYPTNTTFILTVVRDNEPAIKCYKKIGFRTINSKRGRKIINTMELTSK